MSNYGRDSLEKQGDASVKVGAAILGSIAAVAIGSAVSNSSKNKIKEQIQRYNAAIGDCDRKIAELRAGLLGSIVNADQIEAVQSKREEYIQERNRLYNELN